jgi:hypothetical protein
LSAGRAVVKALEGHTFDLPQCGRKAYAHKGCNFSLVAIVIHFAEKFYDQTVMQREDAEMHPLWSL